MRYIEFVEQDTYCKQYNTPEGAGCNECPAQDKEHCADKLKNICDKFFKAEIWNSEFIDLIFEIKEFGVCNFSISTIRGDQNEE